MSNLMPPGWTAHQDPQGRWYYHHTPSGTTQWTPPAPQTTSAPQPSYYPPPPQQSYSQSSHSNASQPQYQQPTSSSWGGRYVYNHPVEFKLKEKYFSLSGDNFSIKDVATGQPAFNVKGNAFSFKDSKSLFDVNGNAIYKMTESILSLRGRMQITDSNTKQPVLTLRKKGFIPMLGTSTIQAWRGPTDDGEPDLVCKGDVFRKDFNIKDGHTGATLASVKRKSFTLSNILLEKDTYIIRVEPGIDAALMVFLVIAIDEQYRDDGERKGYGSFF
eukprot:GFKZ01003846.1.p1 GENE.GFKZ01003846.1~~GFKZ01003846.1.p1  ORF type:complete len:273 (-),score=38.78 GFKZ01003846.1:1017-1835(-)